jgi:chaperonin GroES
MTPNMQMNSPNMNPIMEDEASGPAIEPQPTAETKLRSIIEQINIADELDDEELDEIGQECKAGYDADMGTREDWDRCVQEWTKLAIQAREPKTYPWPKASNVKYPLISTAAMQFAARAYPALVPANGKVVNAVVIGKDATGEKLAQASRVSTYMSYQVMHEVAGWEESMDKLLIMLPVVGVLFKKTYWCPIKEQIVSEVILPQHLVVNYWTKSIETAERISHLLFMSPRVVKERQMSGYFSDVDLGDAPMPSAPEYEVKDAPNGDSTTPYSIIEQHTYLDLDDDGYKEPYIVTFHLESAKVLRIAARFDEDTMHFTEEGDLAKIEPIQYFTKFGFIPNPDGSFYDMGFGTLLGPLNEAVNTTINQLIDAGTLNSMQSGFLGKGLRLKLGESAFRPGEWKSVNATGADLKQQIMPLPTKEPSNVLFQLMGSLISSGKELASVAEIFTGKMPGQNTPATTTMATVEQGMKVFTAVYKRIFRSLNEEFKKMYALNGAYLNPETYVAVLDEAVGPEDFQGEKTYNICPGADPSASSQQEKMQKAQALMELLPTGILDPIEVVKRLLEAMEQPNMEKLFNQAIQQTGQMPPPPPDPKMLEMQMKMQADQASSQQKMQHDQIKSELAQRDAQVQTAMKAQQAAIDQQHKMKMAQIEEAAATHKQKIFMVQEAAKTGQNLANTQAQHEQKLTQMKQTEAAKPKPKGANKK